MLALEELISLSAAAAILGNRRGGRKTHSSTLARWATKGLRGVRLETVRAGGIICTSRPALQRFFATLAEVAAGQRSGQPSTFHDTGLRRSETDAITDTGLRAKRLIDSRSKSEGEVV